MTRKEQDQLAIEAFHLLREEFRDEYGTVFQLIDNLHYLKVIVKSRDTTDGNRPAYRLMLRFMSRGATIVRKESGHLAQPKKVMDFTCGNNEALGWRFKSLINNLIAAE